MNEATAKDASRFSALFAAAPRYIIYFAAALLLFFVTLFAFRSHLSATLLNPIPNAALLAPLLLLSSIICLIISFVYVAKSFDLLPESLEQRALLGALLIGFFTIPAEFSSTAVGLLATLHEGAIHYFFPEAIALTALGACGNYLRTKSKLLFLVAPFCFLALMVVGSELRFALLLLLLMLSLQQRLRRDVRESSYHLVTLGGLVLIECLCRLCYASRIPLRPQQLPEYFSDPLYFLFPRLHLKHLEYLTQQSFIEAPFEFLALLPGTAILWLLFLLLGIRLLLKEQRLFLLSFFVVSLFIFPRNYINAFLPIYFSYRLDEFLNFLILTQILLCGAGLKSISSFGKWPRSLILLVAGLSTLVATLSTAYNLAQYRRGIDAELLEQNKQIEAIQDSIAGQAVAIEARVDTELHPLGFAQRAQSLSKHPLNCATTDSPSLMQALCNQAFAALNQGSQFSPYYYSNRVPRLNSRFLPLHNLHLLGFEHVLLQSSLNKEGISRIEANGFASISDVLGLNLVSFEEALPLISPERRPVLYFHYQGGKTFTDFALSIFGQTKILEEYSVITDHAHRVPENIDHIADGVMLSLPPLQPFDLELLDDLTTRGVKVFVLQVGTQIDDVSRVPVIRELNDLSKLGLREEGETVSESKSKIANLYPILGGSRYILRRDYTIAREDLPPGLQSFESNTGQVFIYNPNEKTIELRIGS